MTDTPAKLAAVARVTALGASGSRPVVSPTDVGLIVDTYTLADPAGVLPGATGWDPTYDTNAATAEVWRRKAAAVAGDYTFTADDATYNKGDVLANMLMMEAKYAGLADAASLARIGAASTLDVSARYGSSLDRMASVVIP